MGIWWCSKRTPFSSCKFSFKQLTDGSRWMKIPGCYSFGLFDKIRALILCKMYINCFAALQDVQQN